MEPSSGVSDQELTKSESDEFSYSSEDNRELDVIGQSSKSRENLLLLACLLPCSSSRSRSLNIASIAAAPLCVANLVVFR